MSQDVGGGRRGARILLGAGLVVSTVLLVGAGARLAAKGGSDRTGADGVSAHDAWTAPNQGMTAVYLTIVNGGDDDRLVSASSDIAGATTVMGGDVGLTHRADGTGPSSLDVPVGSTELRPGARHLMLEGLTTSLQPGDSFPLHLEFERAGTIDVDVEVVSWDEAADQAG